MKVLVIPDVHLKPQMFKQATALMHQGIADRAVCLMDIPDDWDKQYDIALYEEFELFVALSGEWLQFHGFHDSSKKAAGFAGSCSGE